LQAATKKLSVNAILFGILAGVVGVAVGLGVGIALGSVLAAAFHVSPMEGGAGYFAVAISLMVALVVTPASILLTLYWIPIGT
jgi:ABC-type antimicrobial peptide transport system permease subunit